MCPIMMHDPPTRRWIYTANVGGCRFTSARGRPVLPTDARRLMGGSGEEDELQPWAVGGISDV